MSSDGSVGGPAAPIVSIAIPFRNPGAYFDLAVRSVFAQSFTDWELTLIDDGSTDGSVEWASRIRDPRVKVLADGSHRNLAARLNQSARLARGRFLVRMDADDVMHPRRVATVLSALRQNDDCTVCGSWAYAIDGESRPVGLRRGSLRDDGWHARLRFIHPTVAAPTAWFLANPYNEEVAFTRGEDAELWIRTRLTTRRVIVPAALLFYREVGIYRHDAYRQTATALRTIIDRIGGPWWLARRLRLTAINSIMSTSYRLRCANYWVQRRSRPLDPVQEQEAVEAMAQVRRAIIPGIG